jgi:inorganic phosphate transporter, PiT family
MDTRRQRCLQRVRIRRRIKDGLIHTGCSYCLCFVILGAVVQGSGAADTLSRLGSVNAMGGAFTVALAAGLTVYFMTRAGLPVSTTQAIVGAIIGWNFFTDNAVDTRALTQIVSTWITGPVLGALFAYGLYHLVKTARRRIRMHLIKYESGSARV